MGEAVKTESFLPGTKILLNFTLKRYQQEKSDPTGSLGIAYHLCDHEILNKPLHLK